MSRQRLALRKRARNLNQPAGFFDFLEVALMLLFLTIAGLFTIMPFYLFLGGWVWLLGDVCGMSEMGSGAEIVFVGTIGLVGAWWWLIVRLYERHWIPALIILAMPYVVTLGWMAYDVYKF